MSTFNISKRNKVKRVPKRGHYDHATVYEILDAGSVCHVGFVVDGQPFVIPTLYGRYENKIFFHGASSSRMLKNLEQGVQVCITVTHIDGLVLARSAFHHSMNYRSVVVFGLAKKVSDKEKDSALRIISENVIEGRWREVRPPSDKELKATMVLAIDIDQASAKIRQGPPVDDPEDHELNVWAGVIPIQLRYEEPIPDDLLKDHVETSTSINKLLKN